jgi:hypothetical protein
MSLTAISLPYLVLLACFLADLHDLISANDCAKTYAAREGPIHLFRTSINPPPVLPTIIESLSEQTSRSLLYHELPVTQTDHLGNFSAISLVRTCTSPVPAVRVPPC